MHTYKYNLKQVKINVNHKSQYNKIIKCSKKKIIINIKSKIYVKKKKEKKLGRLYNNKIL